MNTGRGVVWFNRRLLRCASQSIRNITGRVALQRREYRPRKLIVPGRAHVQSK